jgi:fructoselysine 6-kinase
MTDRGIVGVGDNTVDRYPDLNQMFPGGNALNVAVMAKRLGLQASYVGGIGQDANGQFLCDVLDAEGVDRSHCQLIDGLTAWSDASLVDGDRVWLASNPGVARQLRLGDDDLRFIRTHRIAHTTIYSGLDEVQLSRLRGATPMLSCDFSDVANRSDFTRMLPFVNFAVMSAPMESPEAVRSLARWIADAGPELVLITQGQAGATLLVTRSARGEAGFHHQAAVPTTVTDTLGAGDAFVASLLVAYLNEVPVSLALRAAAESAAATCRHYGAIGHGRLLQAGAENDRRSMVNHPEPA